MYDVVERLSAGLYDSDVWPLFGPQAGGTLITITGSQWVEQLEQPVIAFISTKSHQLITLPTNFSHGYATTVLSYV